jgi:hypothetical protein
MRTDLGLFDWLFGRKVTIQLPQPDGSLREVRVSERWFNEMKRQGKITPISTPQVQQASSTPQTVKVHIVDTCIDLGELMGIPNEALEDMGVHTVKERCRVETWTIGKEVSLADYGRFLDKSTSALYAAVMVLKGERQCRLVPKMTWMLMKRQFE